MADKQQELLLNWHPVVIHCSKWLMLKVLQPELVLSVFLGYKRLVNK